MTNSERDDLLIEISKNVAVINTKLDADFRALHGNGQPGLIYNVGAIKERVQAIEDAHKAEGKHIGFIAVIVAFCVNTGLGLYAIFKHN
ncbi:MAG: hypothetical protein A2020_07970 [Lentisphaerae bacterium GWF2_45_14]|nr:MAG: hypothetical protein A2020_07970 [Lentisphaerae bacterium GWF2_45_14]